MIFSNQKRKLHCFSGLEHVLGPLFLYYSRSDFIQKLSMAMHLVTVIGIETVVYNNMKVYIWCRITHTTDHGNNKKERKVEIKQKKLK